jgi:hypothetical protein
VALEGMMMDIQIEKNVPIPPIFKNGRRPIYPFGQMEAGDSFALCFDDIDGPNRVRSKLSGAVINYQRKNKTKKFLTHLDREKGEVRVWRIG